MQTSSAIDELFAKNPAVQSRTVVNGYSLIDSQFKLNMATFFVTLKDSRSAIRSSQRASKESADAVLKEVAGEAQKIRIIWSASEF